MNMRLFFFASGLLLAACASDSDPVQVGDSTGTGAPGTAAAVSVPPPATPESQSSGAESEDDKAGQATARLVESEVATIGLDPTSGSPVVLLQDREGGDFVPIWIGIAEAQAIAIALHGVEMPRPMSHDLMRSLVEAAGLEVQAVEVIALRGSTYHARILATTALGKEVEIDSRPSDSIALALRLQVPIRIDVELLTAHPDFRFQPGEPRQQILRTSGITLVQSDPERAAAFGHDQAQSGLLVIAVGAEAPEGIEVGDLVREVDGEEVHAPADLLQILRQRGDRALPLIILRAGERLERSLPAPSAPALPQPEPAQPEAGSSIEA